MDVYRYFREEVTKIIKSLSDKKLLAADLDITKVQFEPPKDPTHGDIATNIAMLLSKSVKMKPHKLACLITEELNKMDEVSSVSVAGPGFINLKLTDYFWHEQLREVLSQGDAYGSSDMGNLKKVNVEYISANPTGPLHIAHARGAVFGDVISKILEKVGFLVTKEYYINDAGTQINELGRSAYLRYKEALGEKIGEIPEGLYPGKYMIPIGQALANTYGNKWRTEDEQAWLEIFSKFSVNKMMELVKEDLNALGICQDVFTSERDLLDSGKVEATLNFLTSKDLVYTGTLPPPRGKPQQDDWEARPQLLFKAMNFGDDTDRPLQKVDGEWTYFASDIANHHDKFRRGFGRLINVWGADHGGYINRMRAAVTAVTDGQSHLEVKICQLVHLKKNGKLVRMSKRAGNFVTLRDLIDEVGKDVVRFMMLTRNNDSQMDFDLTKAVEQSRENPVFYVQYAHARCCSILRHAREEFTHADLDIKNLACVELTQIVDSSELTLIKMLAGWPRIIEGAAIALEPHRIAFYLYNLASQFHSLWNKGKDNAHLRFINLENRELTMSRLALTEGLRVVIASGLNVMGVTPVEELR